MVVRRWGSSPSARAAATEGVLEDPGVGLCTTVCKLPRGALGPCVWQLRLPPVVSTTGAHGSRPSGRFRSVGSESRGIAVRVRSRDPAGVPGFRLGCRSHRAASGPEKPPSVAAGGEGRGLAMTGRPATANGVDGHARGSRVRRLGLEESRSVREGASDRGTWGPSRASRESGLGDSAVASNTRPPIVTGAPESRRVQVCGRRKAAPDRDRVGRSERHRVKRSRPRRAIAVIERNPGARL